MSTKPETKHEKKLKNKKYAQELRKLQAELCKLQDWVKHKGLRVIIIFEGRDGAGKGGTIRAITERVSPRVFRVVALPAPSDREKSQMYNPALHGAFPGGGRSRHFRPGAGTTASAWNMSWVFAARNSTPVSLSFARSPRNTSWTAASLLIKFWLEVSDKEQKRRFEARITDPIRQWKLSPMDLPSRTKWFEYSRARDMMLKATDTKWAPWRILISDDKKRARLNCIHHLLKLIPYKKVPREEIKLPKRSMKGAYDDQATLKDRKFVPEKY